MPKKKTRAESGGHGGTLAASAARSGSAVKAQGTGKLPGGKVKHAVSSSPLLHRWPLLVLLTSLAGLLVAMVVVILSLLSVTASLGAPVSGSARGPVPTTNPALPAATGGPASAAPVSTNAAMLDRRSKGRPDAPVVITEWFDYQCPSCGRFALTRMPDIEKQYVDTGKVRWVSRNFAFLGQESFYAAEAAEAAADQGRYWDFYKLVFSRQQGENLGAFRPENLKRFAAELGLDQKTFDDALDQGKYRASVVAEQKEGAMLGVKATPSFFINGRLIEGVPTVDSMSKLIDQELAKKQ